ncbi:hypothetical protein GCM10010168_39170 [Actinoplanes ianthinogenes]|uniref:Uncharacterized protein n=1 Tax=Actinoplanes ianthinogenes TaxID=122358 RepID=A0ABM7LWQ6_9ACTN|nr:hypothetical protein Aiant_44310 [Actinoplanes ianthinogenes]GGR17721.1 hypothetical protein GCM10010168_39170 [Actinoplanes ianthinogenes]
MISKVSALINRQSLTVPRTVLNVTEVPQHAFDDATQILTCALSGDSDAVASTFDAVVSRDGVVGAWDVAWCLAATMVGDLPGGGGWTLEFPGIDDARYDKRWVARFVSAYVNGDFPTGEALFGAAIADGQLPDCLLALAGSTVATLRHRAA